MIAAKFYIKINSLLHLLIEFAKIKNLNNIKLKTG